MKVSVSEVLEVIHESESNPLNPIHNSRHPLHKDCCVAIQKLREFLWKESELTTNVRKDRGSKSKYQIPYSEAI